jgi:serine O-acetyltransferase
VVGETSRIGNHVKVYQGVTLGAISTRGGQKLRGVTRHPMLEDEVTVYSGASILGGETVIRKGVVISSNVFVTRSVPPNTRVSVKNPELQYRDQKPKTFKQEPPLDWQI